MGCHLRKKYNLKNRQIKSCRKKIRTYFVVLPSINNILKTNLKHLKSSWRTGEVTTKVSPYTFITYRYVNTHTYTHANAYTDGPLKLVVDSGGGWQDRTMALSVAARNNVVIVFAAIDHCGTRRRRGHRDAVRKRRGGCAAARPR